MIRLVTAASTVGSLIEWYEVFAYVSLSSYISKNFFPQQDPVAATILTWLVFATTFVVRPVGAVLFGHLGDRVGRKATFLATLLLMGVATFLIGLLPTYGQIGVAAPVLLTVLRILQGLSLGGELGGAVTYVLEHAPSRSRAFYVGFIAATPPLGLGLSSFTLVATAALMPPQAFQDYGWRVPFLVSIVLTVLGLVLRLKLAETPLFEKIRGEGAVSKMPVVEAVARYPGYILVGVAVAAGHAVLAYTSTGYIFPFLTQVVKLSPVEANLAVGLATVAQLPFYIINAWLADRVGRRVIYSAGVALALATYYPIFSWLVGVKDVGSVALGVFVLVLATAFTFSVLGTALAEMFPTRVRYTGMSLAINLGIGLFGGFTPSIVQAISLWLKNPLAGVLLYTYVVAGFALAVALLLMPETKDKPLD
ncbi:MFS transporter [Pyrobaculum neutrophilum]|uniref:General substrate transporter n=1 Tax=Pyrobaculum neutrophilum (strain DSM 2338 / JCM 9278 / NBRC 100436 / V24Sta) TaxID=444157 RepID=B1YB87_PYRNV|nr:MFS transporter [Pyrobaculum neutrophilum]ACB39218.1 General substrate transporter [Pyrobaculum neutrophilum V24Sta]